MGDHRVGVHDIGVFMVHVEQIYLVREQAAIETAFFGEHYMITVRVGVDHACAYTARRGLAADDYALNTELCEMCRQRGAIECAGTLLGDHYVTRLWLELWSDGIIRCLSRRVHALGSVYEVGAAGAAHVAGRVEDWQARRPCGFEEFFRRLNRLIGILATSARIIFGDFVRRMRPPR
jgi:hypothetical protein